MILRILLALFLSCSVAIAGQGMGPGPGVKGYGGGATYGTELHTAQNAAFPTASDYNATTGWTGTGLATFTSSTTAPDLGTYHIEGTANSDTDRYTYPITSLTAGTLYRIKARVRVATAGQTWKASFGPSVSVALAPLTQAITSDAYADYDRYLVANAGLAYLVIMEDSATNDGGAYLDALSMTEVTGSDLGPEQHTTANAASLTNESNVTAGWTNTGCDNFSSESTGTPSDGTYHILASEGGTPTAGARVSFDLSALSLVEGTHYLITVKVKHTGTGGAWIANYSSSGGLSALAAFETINVTDTTYRNVGFELVYGAAYRYLVFGENNATNDGGVYLDSLTVKEIISK